MRRIARPRDTVAHPGSTSQWQIVRRVRSLKPATYRCPFCGGLLHAMSDHLLVAPDGDLSRRRHAHLECVAKLPRDR